MPPLRYVKVIAALQAGRIAGPRGSFESIPDHYELMQLGLIKLFKERVPEYVRLATVEK